MLGASRIPDPGAGPSRAEEKLFRSLKRRKGRDEHGLFLAEGRRVVAELLESPLDLRLGLAASSFGDSEEEGELLRALEGRCPVRRVAPAVLAGLAETETPQGVLVAARAPEHRLEAREVADGDVVLVLDAVQDPGNLGTLVRTAHALGAPFVVALPGTVDPWNPKVVRAAAGSLFRLPVVQADAAALTAWARAQRVALLAADMDGSAPAEVEPYARAALVVGNEGAGVSPELRAAARAVLTIPLRGGAESLNVAVAAGILLHHLTARGAAPARRPSA